MNLIMVDHYSIKSKELQIYFLKVQLLTFIFFLLQEVYLDLLTLFYFRILKIYFIFILVNQVYLVMENLKILLSFLQMNLLSIFLFNVVIMLLILVSLVRMSNYLEIQISFPQKIILFIDHFMVLLYSFLFILLIKYLFLEQLLYQHHHESYLMTYPQDLLLYEINQLIFILNPKLYSFIFYLKIQFYMRHLLKISCDYLMVSQFLLLCYLVFHYQYCY